MRNNRFVSAVLVGSMALGLSGCGGSILDAYCQMHDHCIIYGTQSIESSSQAMLAETTNNITIGSLYIDMTGTDFPIASTGLVTLTLKSSSGTTLSVQSFTWVKSANLLEFDDLQAVQSWLDQYPSATDVDYSLSNVAVTPQDGQTHTIASAMYYQGSSIASASQTFVAACSTINSQYECIGD